MIKVTTLQSHYGKQGFKRAGDEYFVTEKEAAQLKGNKLVSAEVPAEVPKEGKKIFISDKPREKKEIVPEVEKEETTAGDIPAPKKKKKE